MYRGLSSARKTCGPIALPGRGQRLIVKGTTGKHTGSPGNKGHGRSDNLFRAPCNISRHDRQVQNGHSTETLSKVKRDEQSDFGGVVCGYDQEDNSADDVG